MSGSTDRDLRLPEPPVLDERGHDGAARSPAGPRKEPRPDAAAGSRPGVARSTRVVIRHVDPWSVFKLAFLFYLSVCLVLLVAAALLWMGAAVVGVIENVEQFIEDVGFEDFRFDPGQMLQASTVAGFVLVVGGTVSAALLAVLYNLIADVVGGVTVTLGEDVATPRGRGRRRR